MLYRQKRRKKVAKTTGTENTFSYMEKHPAEDIIDEVILHEKKYQDMPLDELCSMIDLISPTTDNYPYVIDFRTDYCATGTGAILYSEKCFSQGNGVSQRFCLWA